MNNLMQMAPVDKYNPCMYEWSSYEVTTDRMN